jgi:hypothetical protein
MRKKLLAKPVNQIVEQGLRRRSVVSPGNSIRNIVHFTMVEKLPTLIIDETNYLTCRDTEPSSLFAMTSSNPQNMGKGLVWPLRTHRLFLKQMDYSISLSVKA